MILYFLILQDIQYNLYGYVLPFFYYNVISFSFFIKNNFFNIIIKPNKKDKLVKKNLFKKSNNKSYTLFAITNLLPLILFIFLSIGYNQIIWFNHLKINNFNVGLSLFIILFLFLLIFCYLGIHNINANYTVDYIFSVCLISSFLPFLFLANTIYTLVFILELNSSLVFYKFVTSNFWFKDRKTTKFLSKKKLSKVYPKPYINTLFFQYWATFFSSSLILYSISNLFLVYGSSEWLFIDFLSQTNFNILYFNDFFFLTVSWFSFVFGFFLKIGLAPFHLFKLEVYKGLPFVSIFFYTTVYFLSFFIYFMLLLINLASNAFLIIWYTFYFLLLISGIYLVSLIFDSHFTKVFFGYSTVINAYSLFLLYISSINF